MHEKICKCIEWFLDDDVTLDVRVTFNIFEILQVILNLLDFVSVFIPWN
jgi:hypothetical protein